MVEVIYLKKGERRPRDEKSVLIECKPGRRGEEFEQSPSGFTIRTRLGALDATIEELHWKGVEKIYVRVQGSVAGPGLGAETLVGSWRSWSLLATSTSTSANPSFLSRLRQR